MKNRNLFLPVILLVSSIFITQPGLGNPSLKVNLYNSEQTPQGFKNPEVNAGAEFNSFVQVSSIEFELFYDTLFNVKEYDFSNTWFNPDGLAEIQIENFSTDKKLRIMLSRPNAVSGHGILLRIGGVGIIDVLEVRSQRVVLLEVNSGNPCNIYPTLIRDFFRIDVQEHVELAYLISSTGKTVRRFEDIGIGIHQINVELLPRGVYFWEGIAEGRKFIQKILLYP